MCPIVRDHVEFVCPGQVEARPLRLPLTADPIHGKPRSGDAEAGNGAVLLELPAG